MGKSATPTTNLLLALLPDDARERIFPHLKRVKLPLGQVICEAGQHVDYVYFPANAIVSLLIQTVDGASAEICVIGNDGVVGISVFMGGENTPSRAIVQSAGSTYRLPATEFRKEFNHSPDVRMIMLHYTQALITQMAQTAVCNRHHSIEQQLCRWLLLSLDRLSTYELSMTQELIANMLGVRREGVTEAAGNLQRDGIIRYSRGRITVLDRMRLEQNVCECYAVVKVEFDRLLSDLPLAPASTPV
jgi:CRP-like cAMP-binding protein